MDWKNLFTSFDRRISRQPFWIGTIILMVVSEFAAATQGIGYFILYAQQTFQTTSMWTGILVLGIVGSILNFLFLRLERRLLRWHYQARRALQVA